MRSAAWQTRTAELRALLPLGVGEQAAVLRDANRMVEAFRAGAAEIPEGYGGSCGGLGSRLPNLALRLAAVDGGLPIAKPPRP
jgi:hypothetical protein